MPTSQPLSHSPMLVLRKIEELHKQLEITKKKQEAEHAACLWCKEEEHCEHEEKERKDHEEKVQKEAEVKVWKEAEAKAQKEVEAKAWKEAEAKAQREKQEKKKQEHMEKEKGKEKVSGTPIVMYPVAHRHYRRLSS